MLVTSTSRRASSALCAPEVHVYPCMIELSVSCLDQARFTNHPKTDQCNPSLRSDEANYLVQFSLPSKERLLGFLGIEIEQRQSGPLSAQPTP